MPGNAAEGNGVFLPLVARREAMSRTGAAVTASSKNIS
jgi:hypothetical protein